MKGKRDRAGKTLILGVGNPILGDEGFGVHVARRLKEIKLPDGIVVSEGHVGGFDLLGALEGARRVIVVDVMIKELAPGEICFFRPEHGFTEPGKRIISFHQVGVLELVQMWRLLGHEPEVYFLVTRPEKLTWSTEMSAPVEAAANKAVAFLQDICADNFTRLGRSLSLCSS